MSSEQSASCGCSRASPPPQVDVLRCHIRRLEDRLEQLYAAPRTDRRAVWSMVRVLSVCYFEYIVVHECRERWLARLRPWLRQLGARPFYGFYGDAHDTPCIYAIVSQLTGMVYIGETCNFQQRVFQHLYHATAWRRETQYVHRFMRHFGAHKFLVIPLVGGVTCEQSRTCMERKLIRMLRPALNVEHAPPAQHVLAGGLVASSGVGLHGKGGRPLMRQRPVSSACLPAHVKERCVMYRSGGTEFQSLDMLFHAAQAAGTSSFCVVVSPGVVSLSSRDVLRLQYGSSRVSVVDPYDRKVLVAGILKRCLHAVAPPLLHGVLLLVHSLKHFPCLSADHQQLLREWSRDRGVVRVLYYLGIWDLVRLHKAAKLWPDRQQCRYFRQRIAFVFHQRCGFPLQHQPVLTLPYLGPRAAKFTQVAQLLLKHVLHRAFSFMPREFREHYIARARVVVRRGVCVEDMFLNYRQFAAAFDPKEPFKCVCKHYRGFPKQKGHVCCRADDPKWPRCFPSVCVHGKYVPYQPVHVAASQLIEQFVSLLFKFGKLAYPDAVRGTLMSVAPVLTWLLHPSESGVEPLCVPDKHSFEYLQDAWEQLQDLVCLQLDRNLHCLVFQCPRLFWDNMMELYVRDPHYKQVRISEDLLLLGLKFEWRQRGWDKIASLYGGARTASAYYIPKNKDVVKLRPIIPSRHHPLRNVFNICSRALSFVLESADFQHFNLPATTGMKRWLEGVNADFEALDPPPEGLHVFGHDVKQMYTDMQHDKIMAAVQWLVQRVEQQRLSVVLSVRRKGRGGVTWGKNGNSRAYATVTLQQLVDVARFELEHAIFRVGTVFMWQQVGLAMGGFNSPPLAFIACAVDEFHWLRSLGAEARLVHGMRYVDDSTLAIFASAAVASRIVSSYRTSCYGGGLVLESTGDCSAGELEILECMVRADTSGLAMRHRNRNELSLQACAECLAFMKVVPFSSAVPMSTLRNNAVGLLHRLEMNTSDCDWFSVVQALHLSHREHVRMGYPVSFLVKCLAKALPGLVQLNPRWLLVSTVFSMVVGSSWRPWHSMH